MPILEETLITHTKGVFVCNIQEFSKAVLEKNIFKDLNKFCYVQNVFGYKFSDNVGDNTI